MESREEILVMVEKVAFNMTQFLQDGLESLLLPLDHIFTHCEEQNLLRYNVISIWEKVIDVCLQSSS